MGPSEGLFFRLRPRPQEPHVCRDWKGLGRRAGSCPPLGSGAVLAGQPGVRARQPGPGAAASMSRREPFQVHPSSFLSGGPPAGEDRVAMTHIGKSRHRRDLVIRVMSLLFLVL